MARNEASIAPVDHPLVLLGTLVLAGTGVMAVVSPVGLPTTVAQLSLPGTVGAVLVAYGWRSDDATTAQFRRTVLRWTLGGLVAFFLLGGWFGLLARTFDTSFLLAVYASLSTGAAVGATYGVFSARLRRTNEDLADESQRMEEFAHVVSHDLRNPLTVAEGHLELAREESDSDRLDAVERAHARMDDLIDDILALARVGEDAIDAEPVALDHVADAAWRTVETDRATVRIETDAVVLADRGHLRQILENLFRNSVEHGREGDAGTALTDGAGEAGVEDDTGEDGSIESTGEDGSGDDDALTVTVGDLADGFYVADDGPGIPEDEREDVFEMGYSTSDDGTGFGLRIVDRIADAHGWEVTATESADGGARFEFTGVAVRE